MKIIKLTVLIFSISLIMIQTQAQTKTFFDFKTTTIDGKPFDLASLKGKKVLVVNTASKCGNTPQYAQLEDLYERFGPEKFVIIGFPANNFFKQEPGTNEEIKQFCQVNYGVTFPMMAKISVKGKDIDPIYAWLTQKSENGVMDAPVKWNFQKFMIDEKGKLIDVVAPGESPLTEKITSWLEPK